MVCCRLKGKPMFKLYYKGSDVEVAQGDIIYMKGEALVLTGDADVIDTGVGNGWLFVETDQGVRYGSDLGIIHVWV